MWRLWKINHKRICYLLWRDTFSRGCKFFCVYTRKILSVKFRYVPYAVELWNGICCRFLFLIIVLPASMFLYRNFYFFAPKPKHPSSFSPWALPTPDLWNKSGISDNTIDADGIRLGTAASLTVRCPWLSFFTDIVSASLHRGR